MIIHHTFFNRVTTRLITGLLLLIVLRPAVAAQQNILIVGDSISAAYGMSLEQGWVALMAGQIADTHPDYAVVNASISGETTAGALQRLPALLQEHHPAVVVIELGGNDGLRGYPLTSLRRNLTEMAKLAKSAGAEVILVPMEIPPNYGSRYTEGFRESYLLAAKNTDSVLSPFLLKDVALDPALMQADGIHPSVAAQSTLTATFLPTLLACCLDGQ